MPRGADELTGDRARAGWATAALAAALALAVGSCAQIEPPSGGPEDTEPPRVTAAFPESAAVQVPRGDSLALCFSESVDRRAVEEAFVFSPPVEYRERSWKENTWILRLREPLREGVTYAGLLGIGAKDHHGVALKKPWSWAFSTGDSLDTGSISGKVVGQRFPGRGAAVYAWLWDPAVPDTTREGPPPDPLRVGQADPQGIYELSYLPRGRPLRICALYDRNSNRAFDREQDRWAVLDEPLVVPDTGKVQTGIDLFLAAADEPGTVAGTLADSSCLRSNAVKLLRDARARRDSLRGWLDGDIAEPPDLPGISAARRIEPGSADFDSMGGTAVELTADDSLLIGREYLRLDSLEVAARADSVYCALPLIVRLLEGDSTLVREASGGRFSWADVPPGIYRLFGFRDLDNNGQPGADEPSVRWKHALELLPLRTLGDLELELPSGETRSGVETETPGAIPADTLRENGESP